MTWQSMKQKLVVAVAAVLAAACGQVESPDYAGEPLATFQGQLTSQSAVPAGNGVRLALAWYPHLGGAGQGAPKSILTEDVVYRGSFPLNYTFNVHKPPPRDALGDVSSEGGPKSVAMGLLIAYEDLNGNGKLDTIPVTGAPVDRVLGASADLLGGDGTFVLYVDEPAPGTGDAFSRSLSRGFNLVKLTRSGEESVPTVVPLDTGIVINLSTDPLLNVYVCEGLFNDAAEPSDSPICGITASPGEQSDEAQLMGVLQVGDYGASVWIGVIVGEEEIANATVTIDGTVIPSDNMGSYGALGLTGELLRPGQSHVVEAVVPGKGTVRRTVTLPGTFSLLTPESPDALVSGERFAASWSASSGAESYMLSLSTQENFEQLVWEQAWESTTFTSASPIDYAGSAQWTVVAQAPMQGGFSASVSASVEVTFVTP